MERREDLRAGDSDRELVVDRLRDALNEGRINLTEYDERLQEAYSAKTYGELDKLLHDLPKVTLAEGSRLAKSSMRGNPPAPMSPEGEPRHGRPKNWLWGIWGTWLSASLITTGIWAAGALTSTSGRHAFWPVWVIVPFGAVCAASTIRRIAAGSHHHNDAANHREGDHDAHRDR